MDKGQRFAIYSRKSKFTGKGESIENQIELCRQYIHLHYGEEVAQAAIIYEDEGFSGGNLDRPQFKKMMQSIQDGSLGGIVVYRLDRISRNIGDFANLIQSLDGLGVKFISIKEQFDTESPMGRAMMYISSVFSQLERETIAERIRDNMHELSKTGRWLGGTTPTGYESESSTQITVDGKTKRACSLKPIPEELELVTLLYNTFLNTGSLTKTETYLLQNHYLTKNGNEFSRFAIKAILSNPVYLIADEEAYSYLQEKQVDLFSNHEDFDGIHGIMAYNRTLQQKGKSHQIKPMSEWIVSVGKHPGAISGRTWIAVQAKLNLNKDKGYRKQRSHMALLSGLLRCGDCGNFMRPKVTQRKNSNGDLIYTYMCERKEKSRGERCNIKNCNGNQFDSVVLNELKKLGTDHSDFLIQLARYKKTFQDKTDHYNQLLVQLAKDKSDIQQEISQLLSALAKSGGVTETYILGEIERLDSKIKSIDQQIVTYESLRGDHALPDENFDTLSNLLRSFPESLDNMTVEQKRNAIRTVVREVVWDGKDIHIILFGNEDAYDYSVMPSMGNADDVPLGDVTK